MLWKSDQTIAGQWGGHEGAGCAVLALEVCFNCYYDEVRDAEEGRGKGTRKKVWCQQSELTLHFRDEEERSKGVLLLKRMIEITPYDSEIYVHLAEVTIDMIDIDIDMIDTYHLAHGTIEPKSIIEILQNCIRRPQRERQRTGTNYAHPWDVTLTHSAATANL